MDAPTIVSWCQYATRAAVDDVVPAKQHDGNLLNGTWNLRAFGDLTKAWESKKGDSPKRNFSDIHQIAAVISHFDVVAVQEVRGNIRALRYLLKVLGDDWGFLLTDVTKGPAGNDERLAFLFDTRVKPSGLACELVVWIATDSPTISAGTLDRQFARTPYACSFVTTGARPTTFILVTLHVDWGKKAADRTPELRAIAEWLADWAEQEEDWNHNVIALGDFNISGADDDLYKAFTSPGLEPPPGIADVPRTILDKPKKRHHYDQNAWFNKGTKGPLLTLTCSAASFFDFVPILGGSQTLITLSWRISDHYPLFVEFALPQ
jgi:endonuclease/exonuclease/phosphatase family metal-dependent hydrolase